MGEYVRFKGEEVKIGTMENLYYTSYQKYEQAFKSGLLSEVSGNESPGEYIKPDSGFRFRFPFPDEDKYPFGEIGDFHHYRGVPVKIEPGKEPDINEFLKIITGKGSQLEITQQKLVHRESDGMLCLALVVRNPESGLSCRIEDDPFIHKMIKDIIHNHVLTETDRGKESFTVCCLHGYRMDTGLSYQLEKVRISR